MFRQFSKPIRPSDFAVRETLPAKMLSNGTPASLESVDPVRHLAEPPHALT